MDTRESNETYYIKHRYPELKKMTKPGRKVAMKILHSLYRIYTDPLAFRNVHSVDDVICNYEVFTRTNVLFDIQKEPIEIFFQKEIKGGE